MRCFDLFKLSLDDIDSIAGHASALLDGGDRNNRNLANTITRSGVVLLSGHLEGFVRELAEEAVDEINELGLGAGALPVGLVTNVIEATLAQNAPKRDAAVQRILQMIRADEPCALDRKRLSSTGGNPSVDTIEALFSSFGFSSVVDDLSVKDFEVDSTFVTENQSSAIESQLASALGTDHEAALKNVLNIIDEKWRPRKRRREVGYVSAIQELLKQRNRIAHGESREQVTPEELLGHSAVIRRFGAGLNQLMDAMLGDLKSRARI